MKLDKLKELRTKYNELDKLKNDLVTKQSQKVNTLGSICDEEDIILGLLYKEREERKLDVYGEFDIEKIGEVLAKLAQHIIGTKFKFLVTLDPHSRTVCINNNIVSFEREIAILKKESEEYLPNWNFCFAQASDPEESDIFLYSNYGEYSRCDLRKIEKTHQLTKYNYNKNSFEYYSVIRGERPEGFICDFLSYVSNYRLEHDLKVISENELNDLMNDFLNRYMDKYSRYQKEKEESQEEIKKTEEFLRMLRESTENMQKSFALAKKRQIKRNERYKHLFG